MKSFKINNEKKRILIVFGSKSDSDVFFPIAKSLEKKGIDFDLRIASAHRTPELLLEAMHRHHFDMVIAGAGLAAHLPGVVASKTVAPVIGIPCSGNFGGFDAFMSIVQMPPGIPVLSASVSANPFKTDFLLRNYDSVKITGDIKNKRASDCVDILEKFAVDIDETNALEIHFFDLKSGHPKEDAINVPLAEKETPEDALLLFKKANKGFFVGLNRGDNAAYAAIALIDRLPLSKFREDMGKKVEEDDKAVRKLS